MIRCGSLRSIWPPQLLQLPIRNLSLQRPRATRPRIPDLTVGLPTPPDIRDARTRTVRRSARRQRARDRSRCSTHPGWPDSGNLRARTSPSSIPPYGSKAFPRRGRGNACGAREGLWGGREPGALASVTEPHSAAIQSQARAEASSGAGRRDRVGERGRMPKWGRGIDSGPKPVTSGNGERVRKQRSSAPACSQAARSTTRSLPCGGSSTRPMASARPQRETGSSPRSMRR
jgi:hypothetical protein